MRSRLCRGSQCRSSKGLELADLAAAKCEALEFPARHICDGANAFWDREDWMLSVSDDKGLTLPQLHIVGTQSPAISSKASRLQPCPMNGAFDRLCTLAERATSGSGGGDAPFRRIADAQRAWGRRTRGASSARFRHNLCCGGNA
jgi:hypothetical protein